ncbi:MAG: hypothetical protein JW909_01080 [Planctomycetes bacterium]|nr:hypothetical protein [Planctomycetota bacterium]
MTRKALIPVLLPVAVGMATPSLIIFFVQVSVGGYAVSDSICDIASRQFAKGHNLFLIAVLGCIPFALLAVHVALSAARSIRRAWIVMPAGLLGILSLMVPAHAAIWGPLYGPGHASSTSAIAFLFIPFYCIPTMYLGLLVGWIIARLSAGKAEPEDIPAS